MKAAMPSSVSRHIRFSTIFAGIGIGLLQRHLALLIERLFANPHGRAQFACTVSAKSRVAYPGLQWAVC